MMYAKLSVLMMCLMLGFLQPAQSSEPQSMAAYLGSQSFYPSVTHWISWANFISEFHWSSEEQDPLQREFSKNASSMASPRMSLAALYPSISSSHPKSLASFMSTKDPADDMVNRLVASTGIDRNDDVKVPERSRSSPDLPFGGSQRFNLGSMDVEAVPQSTQLPSQDQPKSLADSWASSVSHGHQSSIRSLYNDIDDEPRPANDWGEYDESGASELSRGLENAASKVKMLHQSVVSEKPVPASGVKHLRKTVEKYSPDVESTSMEGSTPLSASSLPKLYLHHGKRHAPQAEQQADHLRVSPDDMVTYHLSEVAPPENPSSLASSLRAHVEAEKTKAVLKRVAEKKQEQSVVNPTQSEEAEEVSKNSAMNTVHRHPSKKPKFKVQPEDIHFEESTTVTTTSATTTTTSTAAEKKLHSENSMPTEWDLLFNANAVDGHLDADGVEQVLKKMTNMKNPGSWNWHRFDLDEDGKLSRREFMNAQQVAMRFFRNKK